MKKKMINILRLFRFVVSLSRHVYVGWIVRSYMYKFYYKRCRVIFFWRKRTLQRGGKSTKKDGGTLYGRYKIVRIGTKKARSKEKEKGDRVRSSAAAKLV